MSEDVFTEQTDLEEWEAEREAAHERGEETSLLTAANLAEANRLLKRRNWHKAKQDEINQVFDDEINAHYEAILQLKVRKAKATARHDKSLEWYGKILGDYAIAAVGDRKKDKVVRLPNGNLEVESQQPEVNYGNEKVLADLLHEKGITALYRTKYEPDKKAIKETVFFQDGKAYVPDMDGLAIEVPITKTPRPPKVTITVAE